ncbi:MAG: glycosyltransferase family 4 protein [Nitrospirae bacterium]|nr:glycosyltransferase family 4 protein [Nitrospirota bacterium]
MNPLMRVAIIKSNYTPYGGGEKYTTRLIDAFAKRDIVVDVVTAESVRWEKTSPHVNWVPLKQFRYNNLLRLLSFNASANRHFKATRYDCVLGMDRTDYQTHLRAGGGCHAAWLDRRCTESSALRCLSFRLNPFHRMMLRIEKRAFLSENLKKIFCNSFFVRDEMLRYYPAAAGKLTVVHNGVEWNEFSGVFEQGLREKDTLRRGLSLQNEMFYFLHVGSGYERKGVAKSIEALKMLPEKTGLIVVGKDRNEKQYRGLASRLGLSARVIFCGPQKNVIPFFQSADAFVLPTIYDPFSNASLEALAMGLYTVTSNSNGCSEVIQEGAGAIIKDLKNIGSVAGAMSTAMQKHRSKTEIRESVRHLEFEGQLGKIVDGCLSEDVPC